MVAERFTFVHLANVDLDDGTFEGVQGVENCDGVVSQRTWVDDDRGGLFAGFVDPVDDLTFVV